MGERHAPFTSPPATASGDISRFDSRATPSARAGVHDERVDVGWLADGSRTTRGWLARFAIARSGKTATLRQVANENQYQQRDHSFFFIGVKRFFAVLSAKKRCPALSLFARTAKFRWWLIAPVAAR